MIRIMKKIYLIGLMCAFFISAQAQTTKDLFAENDFQYVWFGVDYTNAKLIGDFYATNFGSSEPRHFIKDNYYKAWNDLIKNEKRKFSVENMLKKAEVTYDIKMMEALNQTGGYENLEADKGEQLSEETLTNAIKNYNLGYDSGVGVVIIAEYLDKSMAEASYVLEIFNIATREKLIEERFVTKPVGFGVRNYWAGSLYPIFKEVADKRYKAWKKENK